MKCADVESKMNSFIKETLKGNELRKTYYHIENCEACREVLLDEFSFYMVFNDCDNALDFNYRKNLKELLDRTKRKIEIYDETLKTKYIIYSVFICIAFSIILGLAMKFMYTRAM